MGKATDHFKGQIQMKKATTNYIKGEQNASHISLIEQIIGSENIKK